MKKASNKKSSTTIYLSSLYFSLHSCELECMQVCINEGGRLPIYTFQLTHIMHDQGQPLTLTRLTYPRDNPKIYYMMLHSDYFPHLQWRLYLKVHT